MAVNGMGEFVDLDEPRRTTVRTDAQIREEALRRLVDAGLVRVCDVCGKPFRLDRYRNRKRCSWACKMEANRRRARERAARARAERRRAG